MEATVRDASIVPAEMVKSVWSQRLKYPTEMESLFHDNINNSNNVVMVKLFFC